MQEHLEDGRQHGLGAPTPPGRRRVAVGAVLDDVEVDVGELGHHIVVQGAVHAVETVLRVGLLHLGVDLAHAGKRAGIHGQQLFHGDGVRRRVEVVELGEQEAERVAEAAVGVARALEDLVVDSHVGRGVDRRHPQADDVGAHLVADLVGVDDVA